MSNTNLNFDEFDFPTRKEWLDKINSELKEKSIDDLNADWYGIDVTPFLDQTNSPFITGGPQTMPSSWNMVVDHFEDTPENFYNDVEFVAFDAPTKGGAWYNLGVAPESCESGEAVLNLKPSVSNAHWFENANEQCTPFSIINPNANIVGEGEIR